MLSVIFDEWSSIERTRQQAAKSDRKGSSWNSASCGVSSTILRLSRRHLPCRPGSCPTNTMLTTTKMGYPGIVNTTRRSSFSWYLRSLAAA
ncbi:hypothetical protein IG631_05502 [Alternaria alternata]|nr:hypothetical protein IG631_05502 [Alternaria alternata]